MKIIPGQQWGEGEAITGTGLNGQTQENINIINGGIQHTEIPDEAIDYTALSMNPMCKYYTLKDVASDVSFSGNDLAKGYTKLNSASVTGLKDGFFRGSCSVTIDNIGNWTTPTVPSSLTGYSYNWYSVSIWLGGRKIAETSYIGKGLHTVNIPFFTAVSSGDTKFEVKIKGYAWAAIDYFGGGGETAVITKKRLYAWAKNTYR
jgi:hypothetical protein